MKRVIIFGGTGFLGQSLARHLRIRGYTPILVARNKPKPLAYSFEPWDARTVGDWKELLEGAEAIVNLAGKSVNCIKTPDNCDLILRSRVDSTYAIGAALQGIEKPPKVWIQMSTAHIYGDPPSEICTEESTFGYGLAPFVGKAWEKAFFQAKPEGQRGVVLRTSFVIGRNGGALPSLKQLVKLGLGGKVGHGEQGISWIHEFDFNELVYQSILNSSYSGVYIASAPFPVSNAVFMSTLRKKMGQSIGLSSPAWLTRFGAKWIMTTDPELVLYGRYVRSERLRKASFSFKFPILEKALADLLAT